MTNDEVQASAYFINTIFRQMKNYRVKTLSFEPTVDKTLIFCM